MMAAAKRKREKDDGSRMATNARKVIGDVDTHGETHHAAVVDEVGRSWRIEAIRALRVTPPQRGQGPHSGDQPAARSVAHRPR
jgi:hypothetical protein